MSSAFEEGDRVDLVEEDGERRRGTVLFFNDEGDSCVSFDDEAALYRLGINEVATTYTIPDEHLVTADEDLQPHELPQGERRIYEIETVRDMLVNKAERVYEQADTDDGEQPPSTGAKVEAYGEAVHYLDSVIEAWEEDDTEVSDDE